MYDLHAHILPGVDDGAKDMDAAVRMARVASDDGTKQILCTPHRKDVTENHSIGHIQEVMADFAARLKHDDNDVELLLGMENHLDLDLPDDLASGRALPINGTQYALVEMPFFGRPNYLEEVLFQLQLQGVTPVLAHPERIEAVQNDPDLLARLVERGMLSQVTAGSVTGHFGEKVKKFTHELLQRGLVHVLSSDTHVPRGPRSPVISRGLDAAARIVGRDRALEMVVGTPRAILQGRPVETGGTTESPSPRPWWRFWER